MVLLTFAIVILRYALNTEACCRRASCTCTAYFLCWPSPLASVKTRMCESTSFTVVSHPTNNSGSIWPATFFLLPVAGFMVWVSLPYAANSWQILEGSSEVGGIPAVFLLKTLIPLTGALLIFQGIAGIASILLTKYQA